MAGLARGAGKYEGSKSIAEERCSTLTARGGLKALEFEMTLSISIPSHLSFLLQINCSVDP